MKYLYLLLLLLFPLSLSAQTCDTFTCNYSVGEFNIAIENSTDRILCNELQQRAIIINQLLVVQQKWLACSPALIVKTLQLADAEKENLKLKRAIKRLKRK